MNDLSVDKSENLFRISPNSSLNSEIMEKWQVFVTSFLELAIKKDEWMLWVFALQNAARYYNYIGEKDIAYKLAQEILPYFPGDSIRREKIEAEIQKYKFFY